MPQKTVSTSHSFPPRSEVRLPKLPPLWIAPAFPSPLFCKYLRCFACQPPHSEFFCPSRPLVLSCRHSCLGFLAHFSPCVIPPSPCEPPVTPPRKSLPGDDPPTDFLSIFVWSPHLGRTFLLFKPSNSLNRALPPIWSRFSFLDTGDYHSDPPPPPALVCLLLFEAGPFCHPGVYQGVFPHSLPFPVFPPPLRPQFIPSYPFILPRFPATDTRGGCRSP